jgi:hypothetical protein
MNDDGFVMLMKNKSARVIHSGRDANDGLFTGACYANRLAVKGVPVQPGIFKIAKPMLFKLG